MHKIFEEIRYGFTKMGKQHEIIKYDQEKNQLEYLEVKNGVGMKTSMAWLNSKLDPAKERINELEDGFEDITECSTEVEKWNI